MLSGYIILHPEAHKFSTDFKGINGIDFSDIPGVLQKDEIEISSGIEHILVDAKVPIREFERYFYPKGATIPGMGLNAALKHQLQYDGGLNDYHDALSIYNPDAFRYRTIIRFNDDSTQGSVLGYPSLDNNRESMIRDMIKIYTSKRGLNSPFFILTNPESYEDVMKVLITLNLDLEPMN